MAVSHDPHRWSRKLALELAHREVRAYPAVLSTEAVAVAWAREGAPGGAVVVAGYQAAARGRGGIPWHIPDAGFGFSIVIRTELSPEREGWLYVAATAGLSEVLGGTIEWPDQVHAGGRPLGAVGVQASFGLGRLDWSVVTVAVFDGGPEPSRRLRRLVDAIEAELATDADEVLAGVRERLSTLGRTVRAFLVPLGPSGPQVEGTAVDVKDDGSLILETEERRRIAVRPQHVGRLDQL